ncbi:MAG: flagellar motor protein MotB [Ktedonobacterales bacterium]|nr:flagellar motor protein MotB [Ktedonobacterales bacterium]
MARKKKAAPKENGERWLLTYADLITLLMVFFVMLFAMSKTDVQKFNALAASLRRAFNVNVLQGQQPVSISPDNGGSSLNVIEQQNLQQIEHILEQVRQSISANPNQISAQVTKDGIAVTISGALLFYNGTNQIKPDGIKLLGSLATYLKGLPNDIRVEGHTDDIPVESAQYPTNWELSSARAVAVVRFLVDINQLPPKRLSAVGFGQYQPIVPNDSREHREANRRAVLVILYGGGAAQAGVTPTPKP